MSHLLHTASSELTAPKIACDGASNDFGYCYFAYGDTTSTTDALTMHYCLVSNCSGVGGIVSVDLSSNQDWTLHGNLALAAAGTGANSAAYLAFAAYNAQSPAVSQVFGLTWGPGNPAPVPSLLTSPAASYPYEKSSPLIIPITGDNGGSSFTSGVTAWRNGYSWSNAAFDSYLWDNAHQVRKVFTSYHSPAADSLSTFDLAGNGTLGGGVWVDEQSSRSTRKVPWVSLNVIPVYLPAIQR
jgi:hypothetical protein